MPKNTIKEMAWQEKQPTHKFVKDKGYPKACKVCERVKDNPIHSLDKETKYKLIHTCKVDINGIGACGCSTYQIVPPQTDKELCIKCKKYPAEKAQTYCEFCLGISEPQTDKTTWEEKFKKMCNLYYPDINMGMAFNFIKNRLEEKQKGIGFSEGYELGKAQALDAYRGKLIKRIEKEREIYSGDKQFGLNRAISIIKEKI